MIYRTRRDDDSYIWHWCSNCSQWPTTNYHEFDSGDRPTYGELCNECRSKEQNGDCQEARVTAEQDVIG